MDYKINNTITKIIIKNLTENEISNVVKLQKESFADMAIYSATWSDSSLEITFVCFQKVSYTQNLTEDWLVRAAV